MSGDTSSRIGRRLGVAKAEHCRLRSPVVCLLPFMTSHEVKFCFIEAQIDYLISFLELVFLPDSLSLSFIYIPSSFTWKLRTRARARARARENMKVGNIPNSIFQILALRDWLLWTWETELMDYYRECSKELRSKPQPPMPFKNITLDTLD
jgi:hypothetical protein